MPLRRASSSISTRRGFLAAASIRTSRTFSGSFSIDEATALTPTIHWFCLLMGVTWGEFGGQWYYLGPETRGQQRETRGGARNLRALGSHWYLAAPPGFWFQYFCF